MTAIDVGHTLHSITTRAWSGMKQMHGNCTSVTADPILRII